MVRLVLPLATLALASASRISVDVSQHEQLEDAEDLVTEVKDQDENAATLEAEFEEEESLDQVPIRCEHRYAGDRRRGQRDCGCIGGSTSRMECFPDDTHDLCSHWDGSAHYCRRRHSAPPPPPRAPPPPPPAYIPGNGRFWEYGSHQSSGTASTPGYMANGWMDPNSEFVLAQSGGPADHDGDPYDLALFTRNNPRDPHHCNSGWAGCCNTEFNCCANCPYGNADRPDWGPRGWSQCMRWFPECGTGAPHPNMPAPAPPPNFPGFGGGGFPSFPGFGGGGDSDSGGGGGGFPSFPGFGWGGDSDSDSESGGGGGGFPSLPDWGSGNSPAPNGGGFPSFGGGGMPQVPGGFGGGGFGGFP